GRDARRFHDALAKRRADIAAVGRPRSGHAAGVRGRSGQDAAEQPPGRRKRFRPSRHAARMRAATRGHVRRHGDIRRAARVVHRVPAAYDTTAVLRRSPGGAAMIGVEDIAKRFGKQGEVRAVDGVSFTAPDGEITGLLGPNGAGKTTLLRVLATLIVPDAGCAAMDGLDVVSERFAVRERVGVLSDARGLYPRLTARENVAYFGSLHGLRGAALDARVESLLDTLGLR